MPPVAAAQSKKTDEELVALATQDNAGAFRELFDRYYKMIHSFCYRTCLDETHAQDIAQETFIKVARSLETFRGESSFKSWLYRIASNSVRDWLRQKIRQNRVDEKMAEYVQVEECTGNEPDHSRVTEALRALPEDLRMAVVLTYYEGMNHASAARVLGCAETTISWRIFRAKKKLKKLLTRRES